MSFLDAEVVVGKLDERVHHGGDLEAASDRFGIPVRDWIDLSTGISPWHWPIPQIPSVVFQRLPPNDRSLENAARMYYGESLSPWLAVPGSQWAIAQVPRVLLRALKIQSGDRVAVPLWGYKEHQVAWERVGAKCIMYKNLRDLARVLREGQAHHAVVISPNNPTTEFCDEAGLEQLTSLLAAKEGWLVVDQAFLDCRQGEAIFHRGSRVVYLRSLGKFFGLAGLRLGFVACDPWLRRELARELGPWGVSHPAQWLGARALGDHRWHAHQRDRIDEACLRWHRWLTERLPCFSWQRAGLFVTGQACERVCERLYRHLALRGVLCRIFTPHKGQNLLRFGLPGCDEDQTWARWFGEFRCRD